MRRSERTANTKASPLNAATSRHELLRLPRSSRSKLLCAVSRISSLRRSHSYAYALFRSLEYILTTFFLNRFEFDHRGCLTFGVFHKGKRITRPLIMWMVAKRWQQGYILE